MHPAETHPITAAPDRSGQPLFSAWSACRCCGLLQRLPEPARGYRRLCSRCHTSFGSGVALPQEALAFAATALILFALAQAYPLMGIEMVGLRHSARIESGVAGLAEHDLSPLALLVLGVAIAAPLWRIVSMIWILLCLRLQRNPRYLRRLFRASERLRAWAMLDVFLLGALVALTKLYDLADINIGIGFWALGLLVLALAALDMTLDRRAVWDRLSPPLLLDTPPDPAASVSCHACHLLHVTGSPGETHPENCLRCGAALHRRTPNSLSTTWALVATGFILYIPANAYPIVTITSFGRTSSSTIMGGVLELMNGEDWPLALIVFTASIAFPLLKLTGLSWLMASLRRKSQSGLAERTCLYRIIEFVGRWSTIDIFVAALLTALVTLGNIATITPGIGVLAFGGVVVMTMFAAESFDPRLIWDAAEKNNDR